MCIACYVRAFAPLQQWGIIECENVGVDSLDVVCIVTNDPTQTGLFDLRQLIGWESRGIFVPKSVSVTKPSKLVDQQALNSRPYPLKEWYYRQYFYIICFNMFILGPTKIVPQIAKSVDYLFVIIETEHSSSKHRPQIYGIRRMFSSCANCGFLLYTNLTLIHKIRVWILDELTYLPILENMSFKLFSRSPT